ncbi:hypothetical protein NHX12_026820 [Muraenolepis orangiensis]|uniref:Copper transport protein n=1 Tax=Muraenolepis orangiensis TaxID=630683 RepID=A0A9Q0INN2_9TELE|nr:hypothetical protein NHX12_026820 [Muraenolepis orangiensis]
MVHGSFHGEERLSRTFGNLREPQRNPTWLTEKNYLMSSQDDMRWLLHGVQTALHVFQVALGYMLMLCVMTYNVWIFLGVLMGSGLGYFLAFPLFGRLSAN